MRPFVIILLAAALTGCANKPATSEPPPDARAVAIVDDAGAAVGWRELVDAASAAEVVIIGEIHGHELGLDVAASLWEDLLAQEGASPALSLEFFSRDTQPYIDDYLTGVIDDEEFQRLTRRTPGNYPPGHARMVESARTADVRVFAANAPSRYTTLARTGGMQRLETLRASQARLVQVPDDVDVDDYRDRFFDLFAGMMASHGGGSTDPEEQQDLIDGFFRAQSVWDATMAETISRAVADGHAPVVHVVGQFHSDHDGGLVQRLRSRRPGVSIVTVSMADEADDEPGRADFVVNVAE